MILQSLKMALEAIAGNKMRSFLTMLGIIIGVIALVVLVSLVSSASDSITDQVSSLGNNMLTVTINDDRGKPLTVAELKGFEENEEIADIAPLGQMSAMAKHGYNNKNVTVYGTTPVYYDIQGLDIEHGRFLKTPDIENSSYIVILSQDAAIELFGKIDVIGETLFINGRNFLVVGVLAEDTSMMAAMMSSLTVYVPFTVTARMSNVGSHVTTFYASATDSNSLDAAESALNTMMMGRFRQDEDAFNIMNLSALMDTMGSITDMLSLLLGGIAAISLLVGGIGIMNIMLVSVTERTREIGIRKAIGANRGSIMSQFLIEALTISFVGCVIGIILSWGILEIVSLIAGDLITFGLSVDVVAIAVAFSLAIGVLFGIYPANKAAVKHPIEALRYEG